MNYFSSYANEFWQNTSTITMNCVQTSTIFFHFFKSLKLSSGPEWKIRTGKTFLVHSYECRIDVRGYVSWCLNVYEVLKLLIDAVPADHLQANRFLTTLDPVYSIPLEQLFQTIWCSGYNTIICTTKYTPSWMNKWHEVQRAHNDLLGVRSDGT